MIREKSNEFLGCCLTYIQDLHDQIDCIDDELQRVATELDRSEHDLSHYKEANAKMAVDNSEKSKELTELKIRMKSANTLVDHQSDIINEVRQLIIDNIVISADADGNEETSIIMYPSDVDKIFELLSITEEDYTEC